MKQMSVTSEKPQLGKWVKEISEWNPTWVETIILKNTHV